MTGRKTANATEASPFLKWAGGKRRLLAILLQRLPEHFVHYYEPFAGGGALRLALPRQRRAVMADRNHNLINTYNWVACDCTTVELHLQELSDRFLACDEVGRQAMYYEVRSEFCSDAANWDSGPYQAARLIFLNKTCFNGLYRESPTSGFNVAFGAYRNPRILPPNLREFSEVINSTTLISGDFREVLGKPVGGDFVYCDPPYDETFCGYTSADFTRVDQKDLAHALRRIEKRGVFWMVSNSDSQFIRQLYAGFRIETIMAPRSISRDGKGREKVQEVIIRNY